MTETDNPATPRRAPAREGRRREVSYLVRFWLEPREQEGETAPFRGYSRDLRTGEEQYFRDPRRLAETILRRLRAADREEVDGSAAAGVEGAVG